MDWFLQCVPPVWNHEESHSSPHVFIRVLLRCRTACSLLSRAAICCYCCLWLFKSNGAMPRTGRGHAAAPLPVTVYGKCCFYSRCAPEILVTPLSSPNVPWCAVSSRWPNDQRHAECRGGVRWGDGQETRVSEQSVCIGCPLLPGVKCCWCSRRSHTAGVGML